jgi:hypothetical protein
MEAVHVILAVLGGAFVLVMLFCFYRELRDFFKR